VLSGYNIPLSEPFISTHSCLQVSELGFFGYDGVVLGRNIAEVSVSIIIC
jgi:hypothetical protein